MGSCIRPLIIGALLLGGCTGESEAIRAAQPHIETFTELRLRALSLLEMRADIERKKLLARAAVEGEESLPENLKPVYEQMQDDRVEITGEQLERGEALFWQMLDGAFSEEAEVLQAEIVFLEKDGSVSRFRHPRERELPAGVRWFGLRQHRTYAGLANCLTDEGSEPCVLLQLRPRDYSGSAGLTVAFRRAGRP